MSMLASRRLARGSAVALAVASLASALAASEGAPGAPPAPAVAVDATPPGAYALEIARWRAQREERLRSADGWLTLAGLFWLNDGPNRAGSAGDSDVRLPAPAPARAAVLDFHDGRTTYRLGPDAAGATLDGAPAPPAGELRSDAQGEPSRLAFGPVSFYVIRRGERFGVRVKDRDSAVRRDFAGLAWYPVDPAFRVRARFLPDAGRRSVRVPNVLGEVEQMASPGQAVFRLGGREVRLTPVLESAQADELFFIFRDATSGKETYPAGRFLYAPLPEDGFVSLDFNKAYSPPCAFTPHATCPLPPAENRLAVAIPAGEKFTGHH